jgi:hypothetical protein
VVEYLKMDHIRPRPGETTTAVLRRSVGGVLLLNVTVSGEATSVCANVERSGSAAWRRKEEGKPRRLDLDSPGFSLTERTLVLNYEDVNTLANNFHAVREAMPAKAVKPDGSVAVGKLPRDGADMGHVLAELERRSDDIVAIRDALNVPLDTKLFSLRRAVGHCVGLMKGGDLSDYANAVLSAFSESQPVYAGLPVLRGFGTENPGRGQDLPNKKGDRLRFYMQRNPKNPLAASRPLDYVAYELKPLNISDGLKWYFGFDSQPEKESDPRTDSVDLLLSLDGIPVYTEVKMAGDKFVSAAVVQLLYYASILVNDGQRSRLAREINKGVPSQEAWLCVIAQQRNDSGFASDLEGALSFLRHEETRKTLAPFFCGAAVLVIEEKPEPFCAATGVPSFRVLPGDEHFIEWRK